MVDFLPCDPHKEQVKLTVKKKLWIESAKMSTSLKDNKFLGLVEWDSVYRQAGLKEDAEKIMKEESHLASHSRNIELSEINTGELARPLNNEHKDTPEMDVLADARLRCYMLTKTLIWEKFEESICGGDTVNKLSELIDYCMDDLHEPIRIWDVVLTQFWSVEDLQRYISWANKPVVGNYMKNLINSNLLDTYETLNALISSLNELRENKPNIPTSKEYYQRVFNECDKNRREAEKYMTV